MSEVNIKPLSSLELLMTFCIFASECVTILRFHVSFCDEMICPCASLSFTSILRDLISCARCENIKNKEGISIQERMLIDRILTEIFLKFPSILNYPLSSLIFTSPRMTGINIPSEEPSRHERFRLELEFLFLLVEANIFNLIIG